MDYFASIRSYFPDLEANEPSPRDFPGNAQFYRRNRTQFPTARIQVRLRTRGQRGELGFDRSDGMDGHRAPMLVSTRFGQDDGRRRWGPRIVGLSQGMQ